MLRALKYMPRLDFLDAVEAFRHTHFGVGFRKVPTAELMSQMDFVCNVERVGKYEPIYSDY